MEETGSYESDPVGPFRKRVFRFILIVCSALFVLLILEIGLRAVYAVDGMKNGTLEKKLLRAKTSFPRDRETAIGDMVLASDFADIVYEFKPGLNCIFRNKRVMTNSRGLRGPEYKIPKPAGVFRIVGLGDSIMFGWGCGQEDFYLRQIEKSLNDMPQPHPVYETINFAVPGYNTAMEVAAFEHKALEYEPDLVIIQFVSNDFGIPMFMLKPNTGLNWKKSYAYEFIKARIGRLRRDYEDERLVFRDFRNLNEEDAGNVQKQYLWMCGAEGYSAAIDKLGRLTKEKGIPVIVLVGTLADDQRGIVMGCARKWGFEVVDIGPYTQRALLRNNIPDNAANWGLVGRVAPGDSHPTPFAHTIYAEGLLEAMYHLKAAPSGSSPLLLKMQADYLIGVWPPAAD